MGVEGRPPQRGCEDPEGPASGAQAPKSPDPRPAAGPDSPDTTSPLEQVRGSSATRNVVKVVTLPSIRI